MAALKWHDAEASIARIGERCPTPRDVSLTAIAPHARTQALRDLDAGHIGAFLDAEPADPRRDDALGLVLRNVGPLIERGFFGLAFVLAYRKGHLLEKWPSATVRFWFSALDAQGLRALGDPLPGTGAWEVFRGGGPGGVGLSWSRDPHVAAYYASHNGMPPQMWRAVIPDADHVRCYFARVFGVSTDMLRHRRSATRMTVVGSLQRRLYRHVRTRRRAARGRRGSGLHQAGGGAMTSSSAVPGVVPPSTCPHCGAPLQCHSQGRTWGATGHGEPAEGRDDGDAAERATEAAGASCSKTSPLKVIRHPITMLSM